MQKKKKIICLFAAVLPSLQLSLIYLFIVSLKILAKVANALERLPRNFLWYGKGDKKNPIG